MYICVYVFMVSLSFSLLPHPLFIYPRRQIILDLSLRKLLPSAYGTFAASPRKKVSMTLRLLVLLSLLLLLLLLYLLLNLLRHNPGTALLKSTP